jgi:hypothetical protein
MQLAKRLIVPACCVFAMLSTAARAETYHFGEGESSMPAHTKHPQPKHKSHARHRASSQSSETPYSHS